MLLVDRRTLVDMSSHNRTIYYIDGTRYDQVDGTGPVVPSVKEDGTR